MVLHRRRTIKSRKKKQEIIRRKERKYWKIIKMEKLSQKAEAAKNPLLKPVTLQTSPWPL